MSAERERGTRRKLKPNRFRITSIVIAATIMFVLSAFAISSNHADRAAFSSNTQWAIQETILNNLTFSCKANLVLADGSIIVAFSNGSLQKSTDGFISWTEIMPSKLNASDARLLYQTSSGALIYGYLASSGNHGLLYRSNTLGLTWTIVAVSNGSGWWGIDEDVNGGYLFAGEYGYDNYPVSKDQNIWRSHDDGVTWIKIYSETRSRHIHAVGVDSGGRIYAGFGDGDHFGSVAEISRGLRSNDNGTTWNDWFYNDGLISRARMNGDLYMGSDAGWVSNFIIKIDKAGKSNVSWYFPRTATGQLPAHQHMVFALTTTLDGRIFAVTTTSTMNTTIWGSPDARNYLKLAELTGEGFGYSSFIEASNILFVSGDASSSACRITVPSKKNMIEDLYGSDSTSSPHSVALQFNSNSTGTMAFCKDGIRTPEVRLKGVSINNKFTTKNPSLELGTTTPTHWSAYAATAYTQWVTGTALSGTKSLKVNGSDGLSVRWGVTLDGADGITALKTYTLSFWAKGENDTVIQSPFAINFQTAGGASISWLTNKRDWAVLSSTSWTIINETFTTPATTGKIVLYVGATQSTVQSFFMDGFMLVQDTSKASNFVYEATASSNGTSITINGQVVTNSSLTNGVYTDWSPLSTFSPIIAVSGVVQGSETIIVEIRGISDFKFNDNHVVESWVSGYVTCSPSTYPISLIMRNSDSRLELPDGRSFQASVTPGYIDVNVLNDAKWTGEASDPSATVTFTLSGLESGKRYRVYVDGAMIENLIAAGGSIRFTYSGPWSEHQFEVIAGGYSSGIVHLGVILGIMMALGVLVSVLVPVVQVAQEKRKFKPDDLIQMVIYIVVSVSLIGLVYALLP